MKITISSLSSTPALRDQLRLHTGHFSMELGQKSARHARHFWSKP